MNSTPQLTEEQRKQLEEKLKNMSPGELREFQKQQCIFCQIVSGKIPSKKVYEDDICLAVLDINPAAKGHLLIMPKEHYVIMPQIPEDSMGHLFFISRHLSQILLKSLKAEGTNIFIANGPAAGQRAQHFMVHLIPRKESDGILEIEEKLIDHEMIRKIKSALEGKLQEVLGVKEKSGAKKEVRKETVKQKEPEHFITSDTARRFHQEKCAFAQNIPTDKKIIMDEKEAFESEKKPCSCVTGKKIPLKREEEQVQSKKMPKGNKRESGLPDEKKEQEQEEQEQEEGGDISLDDIAGLFK